MIDFEYVNPARIIFGEKPYERIAERLKQYHVQSLLMVYSGEFVKSLGIYQEVEKICKEQGIIRHRVFRYKYNILIGCSRLWD